MDLPQGLRLTIEDRPTAEDCEAIGNALDAYNRQFLGETGFSRMGLFIRDEQAGIKAGLVGIVYAGWLYVADLWVHADLRRRGIGTQLLALAEQRAVALGCRFAMLDTFSFQGPEFYPRFGYRVYGVLDYPPRHQRLFLRKVLEPVAGSNFVTLFPVSVKGVLFEGNRVVLLENDRGEWELPGGRLEAGEDPATCLAREVAEELDAEVVVEAIVDSWVYEVQHRREVLILTYGVRRAGRQPLRVSGEHRRFGLFAPDALDGLAMPEGYRRSVRAWAVQCGIR